MGNTGSGSKNRHASGEDTAPTLLTARYAESDFYEQGSPSKRQRARQETADASTSQRLIPTVFKWLGGGKEVYVSGSFNNWKSKIPLARSHGDFLTIIDLPEGDHQYKFYVDGQWMNSDSDPIIRSNIGTHNNFLTVTQTDFDAFEALEVDIKESKKVNYAEYGRYIPDKDDIRGSPPTIPPQLLQSILNEEIPPNVDPSLLSEPNYVVLNHMYALSIRDGVMVMSATHRFRKKYVTTLLYRPAP